MSKKEDYYGLFESMEVGKNQWVECDEVPNLRSYLNRFRTETGRVIKSRYDRDLKKLLLWRVS